MDLGNFTKYEKYSWMAGHTKVYPYNSSLYESLANCNIFDDIMDLAFYFIERKEHPEFKYLLVPTPPYAFASVRNDTVSLSGPLYSIIHETATKLNYS